MPPSGQRCVRKNEEETMNTSRSIIALSIPLLISGCGDIYCYYFVGGACGCSDCWRYSGHKVILKSDTPEDRVLQIAQEKNCQVISDDASVSSELKCGDTQYCSGGPDSSKEVTRDWEKRKSELEDNFRDIPEFESVEEYLVSVC
jgi:hypothetical protein